MATALNFFDTTPVNLLADLVTNITASSDWADVTPAWSTTTAANTTTSQTTGWQVASTAQMYVGMPIKITVGGIDYYRTVTVIQSATLFTINASLGVTTATGQTISFGGKVLKATTTRGAQMAFSVGFENFSFTGTTYPYMVRIHFFRTWTGASGNPADHVDISAARYVRWTGLTAINSTDAIHGMVSAGKEHIIFTLEGPRANETNPDNTSIGSYRSRMFMSDVVPYHAADTTPVVAAHASWGTAVANTNGTDTYLEISRNAANNASWVQATLASLAWPGASGETDMPKLFRQCTIDGNEYLWPYVVIQKAEGIRGRLAKFFYAGWSTYTGGLGNEGGEYIGDVLTYNGSDYQLMTLHKSGATSGSNYSFSPFGSSRGTGAQNSTGAVVAIPKT